MGIRGGVGKLHWVFTATFVAMIVAVPLYSTLVARVPRARAIPLVYRFFLSNLVVFWLLLHFRVAPEWTARVFFVWISVYNLFVVSVFWSFMADLFTSEASRGGACSASSPRAGAPARSPDPPWRRCSWSPWASRTWSSSRRSCSR
jgi:AAA family ATP:ADP antiporter